MMKYPGYFIAEFVALFLSLLYFNKVKKTAIVYIVLLLITTVVYEFGTIRGWFWYKKSNHFAANLFTGIEFVIYNFFFYSAFEKPKIKKTVLSFFILFWAVFFTNLIFYQGVFYYNSYSILFGSLVVIYCCWLIFKAVVSRDSVVNIMNTPLIWIASGFLLFYLFQFANMAHFNYMAYRKDFQYANLFLAISNASNIVLYSCISIAFLCTRTQTPEKL
jgi:hypothetical protein